MTKYLSIILPGLLLACTATAPVSIGDPAISVIESQLSNRLANHVLFRNPSGFATTVSSTGPIDLDNEFFQDLGTNGRRCVSCHLPSAGWSITPSQVRAVFEATRGGEYDDVLGLGAIFRTNDGANSPEADVSTLAKRRAAYSMLLTRGLIRVSLPVPADAEFELVAVDDPYHHASAADLSMFRRPLPTTNLPFLSTVMWDGRHTQPEMTINADLLQQSSSAVQTHALGSPLSAAQRASIVALELSLHTTQVFDTRAHELDGARARGGPEALMAQPFYIGINDIFGDSQTHAPFTPLVFDIYDAWAAADGKGIDENHRAIARGQALFNTRTIHISGVSGINDEAAFGKSAVISGTCTTCHDTPNSGDHSVVAPLNIGLTDASRRTPDMPLYTLRNKTTGELKKTTDPGRAMLSGKWKHIGRFKGPILRGLAMRAPYFHNGFAADLPAVIAFYNTRFDMQLTRQEKADLVAFLQAL
jgi:hypothetical protein